VRAGQDRTSYAPQLDAVQWRMLCAIVRDAIAVACVRGSEAVVFHGYRVEAWRVETDDAVAIEVTVRGPLSAESPLPPVSALRLRIPLQRDQHRSSRGAAPAGGRSAQRFLPLAESARLMRVTHRPNPVRSPENREPQGSEMS